MYRITFTQSRLSTNLEGKCTMTVTDMIANQVGATDS